VTAALARRPLKILHIDPERSWGGGEEQVLGLVTHLAKRGHVNHVATDRRGRLFERSQSLGIRTLPIILRNDLDLRSVPRLRRLIRLQRYDIVHLHTKRAHAISLWLPKSGRSPRYVVTRRMDYAEPNNWYTRLLYNRRVDGVIAISQRIAQLLFEAGVEKSRIRLIHSGIDPQTLNNRQPAPRPFATPPVIGTVAVLEERKGHRYVLEALSSLRREGVRVKYRIAGEGSLKQDLQDCTVRLGLEEDVEFVGFVADIGSFLSSVDIFVLASLYEGLGVALLEAMAAARPVIASRVGGMVDAVVDSVTGFLVGPKDVEELARAIRKLLDDRALAETMGRRGAERVRKNFTLEQMADRNEAYYYDLLAGAIHE
jgi:glycosyltransferase involved in cell wall biosynthesis